MSSTSTVPAPGRRRTLSTSAGSPRRVDVPIQVGGGLRSIDAVRGAVAAGAARIVLGTAAFTDLDFLDEAVAMYPERIVVSVDARAGKLATAGWTEQTEIPVDSVVQRMGDRGVRRFVFSSIDQDGTMSGPDLDGLHTVAQAVRGTLHLLGWDLLAR